MNNLHGNEPFIGNNGNGSIPRVVHADLPDLTTATIQRFVDAAEITPDSRVHLSIPAGPNRQRNFGPGLRIIAGIQHVVPGVAATVELAIDSHEPLDRILEASLEPELPPINLLSVYLPQISEGPLRIKTREQAMSNSVVETILAMREAAEAEATHLIAPRLGTALAARVSRGIAHYVDQFEATSLRVVSSPAHHLFNDEASGSLKRIGLEWFSYLTGEAVRLLGPSMYEQYTERKGIFARVARFAQKLKLKNFEDPAEN